jgi:hypothetical protein
MLASHTSTIPQTTSTLPITTYPFCVSAHLPFISTYLLSRSSSFTGAPFGARVCQAAAYCLMAGINAAMTALFVRSLRRLPSLQATVLSTAANMAATVSLLEPTGPLPTQGVS